MAAEKLSKHQVDFASQEAARLYELILKEKHIEWAKARIEELQRTILEPEDDEGSTQNE